MKKDQCKSIYLRVLEHFSDEEMASIVQLKRFFEWYEGDLDFRKAADKGKFSSAHKERLKKIGVLFNLEDISMLWKSPDEVCQFIGMLQCGREDELSDEIKNEVKKYSLLNLWARFVSYRNSLYKESCGQSQTFRIPENPKFDAWRNRRITTTHSELGHFGYNIDHPILAFELGDGCSVGCWLCAFSAEKLKKNLDYHENREFFRRIAQSSVKIFGRREASMTLLYYGTEPHDNPNYLDFVKDYSEITGSPVCTATAVCTDAEWLRELIAFYRQGPNPWPRLSVLSTGILHKIHDLYSPEELRDCSMIMQMKSSVRIKVSGGNILEERGGMRDREEGKYLDEIVPQGSIACVSGFLTNLVNKTIQLVSPCYTSKRWPLGYRVFDEQTFESADDFGRVIEDMIDRNMPETPYSDMPIKFRDDLIYRSKENGFDLVSPNQIHHFQNNNIFAPLGSLIANKELTYNQLCDELTDNHMINPFIVISAIKNLFDNGFLDEVDLSSSAVKERAEALSL